MHRLKNYRFQILLLALFTYLIVCPFLFDIPFAKIIINIVFSFVLFSSFFTFHKNKNLKIASILLLVLALLPLWLGFFSSKTTALILAIYLALLIYSLVWQVAKAKHFSVNMLYAALALYLIIGLFFGAVFTSLDFLVPGSFAGGLLETVGVAEMRLHSFTYFSFTTLTTLGYGDIVPQTEGAAGLCQGEAIIGQFFIAVMIAELIGIRVAERMRKNG